MTFAAGSPSRVIVKLLTRHSMHYHFAVTNAGHRTFCWTMHAPRRGEYMIRNGMLLR